MIEFLIENYQQIIPTLFGTGGIALYGYERRKRKLEIHQEEINAFKEMQRAYDNYTSHTTEEFKKLQEKIKTLENELYDMRRLYEAEKQKNKICENCKNIM